MIHIFDPPPKWPKKSFWSSFEVDQTDSLNIHKWIKCYNPSLYWSWFTRREESVLIFDPLRYIKVINLIHLQDIMNSELDIFFNGAKRFETGSKFCHYCSHFYLLFWLEVLKQNNVIIFDPILMGTWFLFDPFDWSSAK